MSARTEGTPSLDLGTDGWLVPESRFGEMWSAIVDLSSSWRTLQPSDYLNAWCGASPPDCTERFLGVHHIGIYLGDYEQEQHALSWNAYLACLLDGGAVADVEVGPSYIAPRQYGTQGWLSSVTLSDGAVLETFTCKRYGPWSEKTIEQRRTLMSHAALEVETETDVRHVIDRLEADVEPLEVIAFTEADEFGHTYGHLRNNTSNSVVEIVHQGPVGQDGAGR